MGLGFGVYGLGSLGFRIILVRHVKYMLGYYKVRDSGLISGVGKIFVLALVTWG